MFCRAGRWLCPLLSSLDLHSLTLPHLPVPGLSSGSPSRRESSVSSRTSLCGFPSDIHYFFVRFALFFLWQHHSWLWLLPFCGIAGWGGGMGPGGAGPAVLHRGLWLCPGRRGPACEGPACGTRCLGRGQPGAARRVWAAPRNCSPGLGADVLQQWGFCAQLEGFVQL